MLSKLLTYTLMNPRTILAALAVSLMLNLGLAGAWKVRDAEADGLLTRAVAAEQIVDVQTKAAAGIVDLANLRAETAERAAAAARQAGAADRRAAERYLSLPLPAPEDRCEAAQALVDEAVVENQSR